MRPRWQWIIGLIGLAIAGTAKGQEGTSAAPEEENQKPADANATETSTKPTLTGNPQIDYIHDPNLPHELRGYDLSDYPFYSKLPEDLLLPSFNFSCDDRHDGFYASVPHKCQVYHNCLFGQRYDFLCANYTVFDQKNFICHYVSEVDCKNSARHYDRNDELYETTTTTTTTQAPPQVIYVERPRPLRGPGVIRPNRPRPFGGLKNRRPGNRLGNRRTTTTTPAPVYYDDYYYDEYYDQYYDDYYNDYINEKTTTTTTTTTTPRPRRPNKPKRKRIGGQPGRPGGVFNVGDRKRPRINPPGPRDEFSLQGPRSSRLQQASPAEQQILDDPTNEPNREAPSGLRRRRPGRKPRPGSRPQKKTTTTTTTTTTTEAVPEDEYYDYYYDDYVDEPSSSTTTTTTTTERPIRPQRTRLRGQQRGQQNRQSPKTTTTSTTESPVPEQPRDQESRPSRVNVRRNPLNNRRAPVNRAEPVNAPEEPIPTQEVAESEISRPQRLRPQFPRKRPSPIRSNGNVEEEAISNPNIEVTPNETPSEPSRPEAAEPDNKRILSRVPIRRLGQGGSRQGQFQQRRGQAPRPAPDYAYYDY